MGLHDQPRRHHHLGTMGRHQDRRHLPGPRHELLQPLRPGLGRRLPLPARRRAGPGRPRLPGPAHRPQDRRRTHLGRRHLPDALRNRPEQLVHRERHGDAPGHRSRQRHRDGGRAHLPTRLRHRPRGGRAHRVSHVRPARRRLHLHSHRLSRRPDAGAGPGRARPGPALSSPSESAAGHHGRTVGRAAGFCVGSPGRRLRRAEIRVQTAGASALAGVDDVIGKDKAGSRRSCSPRLTRARTPG
ncbi:hypothetical protein SCOCK_10115 [Actinacidiphila cocklensis]|uniref:Uncharacterized protein n=1 Tax=Actinacidiphila cocklensis TaxID=887465 RepID=A0A9W4DIA5_9ACTN|nr:hypothetical protein SCOCK_10115 [Actinacidiphila cocklensis]